MWLFFAFLAVPLIEIALFIEIGGAIGLFWTLLIVVLTAILGTIMVRTQGALALGQLKTSFDELRDPTEPLAHGAMILFSGALLLTPGFFTDAVGFLLLIPQVRGAVFRYVRTKVEVRSSGAGHGTTRKEPPKDVIEGSYQEIDPKGPSSDGPSGWTRH